MRDQTLETLRRRIISLQLPPGEPLSENELAQEMGVSRTPVRESLILLREEGLVQVYRRSAHSSRSWIWDGFQKRSLSARPSNALPCATSQSTMPALRGFA